MAKASKAQAEIDRLAAIETMENEIYARKCAEKQQARLKLRVLKLKKGLVIVAVRPDQREYNVVANGFFGLKCGESAEWSVVQTATGFRYRHVVGGCFGVSGWTHASSPKLKLATREFALDGLDIVTATMDAAVSKAIADGRVFVPRVSKADKLALAASEDDDNG